jgi:hypothetical protein
MFHRVNDIKAKEDRGPAAHSFALIFTLRAALERRKRPVVLPKCKAKHRKFYNILLIQK